MMRFCLLLVVAVALSAIACDAKLLSSSTFLSRRGKLDAATAVHVRAKVFECGQGAAKCGKERPYCCMSDGLPAESECVQTIEACQAKNPSPKSRPRDDAPDVWQLIPSAHHASVFLKGDYPAKPRRDDSGMTATFKLDYDKLWKKLADMMATLWDFSGNRNAAEALFNVGGVGAANAWAVDNAGFDAVAWPGLAQTTFPNLIKVIFATGVNRAIPLNDVSHKECRTDIKTLAKDNVNRILKLIDDTPYKKWSSGNRPDTLDLLAVHELLRLGSYHSAATLHAYFIDTAMAKLNKKLAKEFGYTPVLMSHPAPNFCSKAMACYKEVTVNHKPDSCDFGGTCSSFRFSNSAEALEDIDHNVRFAYANGIDCARGFDVQGNTGGDPFHPHPADAQVKVVVAAREHAAGGWGGVFGVAPPDAPVGGCTAADNNKCATLPCSRCAMYSRCCVEADNNNRKVAKPSDCTRCIAKSAVVH